MSYLDRIRECNAHDLSRFRPFLAGGVRVGWVKHGFAGRLAAFPDAFRVSESAVVLAPGLDTFAARTAAVDEALRRLAADGLITGWRDEPYPVGPSFRDPPLLQMERAAVPWFGVRAYGVHMNGYVRDGDGIRLWVARRSPDKPTYPGMLDNMVAGGQPVGIGLRENLVKECEEEAGIPPGLAARAVPVGAVSYCHETGEGLKPDVQFTFDLELPPDFQPRNADGEIAAFYLWPVERVMETVRDTTRFKFNCNLVIIDFLVRHGLIGPGDPDYVDIVTGLRRPPP